jgi:putative FmdB family regulatory protein
LSIVTTGEDRTLVRRMPLYEYRCDNGDTFEVLQPMNEASLTSCQVCGAPAQRVLHAPAVHFKGKGFYNTDYGTKKRQREKEASEASSSSDGKGSGSSSGDGKPAEKKPDKKETAGSGSSSSGSSSSSS